MAIVKNSPGIIYNNDSGQCKVGELGCVEQEMAVGVKVC